MHAATHALLGLLLCALPPTERSGEGPAEKVVIKCATLAPEGSTWMNVFEKLNKELYLKTRGRVSFKFFAGGIAGEEKTVLEKIHYGQLQAAGLTGIGMGEILPAARIMELPFYFEEYEEYDYVLERLLPELREGFRGQGFVLLGWAEGGFANLFSKRPYAGLEKLRQAKVWLRSGDPMNEIALHELAVQAVPLTLPDVLTSIQTGLVDTVYVSPLAAIALQWFPHLQHVLHYPVFNIEAALVLEAKTFEKLDEKDQETLLELSDRHFERLVREIREDNRESERVLQDKGLTFHQATEAQRQELERVRRRIARAMVGRLYDEDLLERFEALLAEAREALDEEEAEAAAGGGRTDR